MALRSLDNSLPIVQGISKKQAKILIPAHKNQNQLPDVNDENKPPTADASIDYIPSQNLKEIDDPDFKIQGLVGGLESKDWVKVCESLNDVRRFALYHSNLLVPIMEKLVMIMVKSMKNPRSALCKTSIMTCSDIFEAFGEKLLDGVSFNYTCDAFYQLLLQLLLKACQDKKFVCEEAEKALKIMVEAVTPLPLLLEKLASSVGHSNLRIRAKAGVCISKCVSKMDLEGMKEFGLVELLRIGTNLLHDKLPEAREAARSILLWLYEAMNSENEELEKKVEAWQNFCQSNLSIIHALAVVKLVSS